MAEFEQNESVYAYHGACLYPARVLKVERIPRGFRYFIHYEKWHVRHDEWAESERLMPLNEATREKAKMLNEAALAAANSTKKKPAGSSAAKRRKSEGAGGAAAASSASAASGAATSGRKRKLDVSRETEEPAESPMKLTFPLALKRQLVEDWELVTQRCVCAGRVLSHEWGLRVSVGSFRGAVFGMLETLESPIVGLITAQFY